MPAPQQTTAPPTAGRPPAGPPRGNKALIAVALAMGLITVLLNMLYVSAVRRDLQGTPITVYRLNKDIDAGHRLNAARDLVAVSVPERFRDSMDALGAVVDEDGATDTRDARDRERVTRRATQGELLTFGHFTTAGGALDYQIRAGMRAAALPVSSRNAPGLLRPGMYVDIMADLATESDAARTMVIMERVRVVAVGDDADEAGDGRRGSYSAITVEVEPNEAIALLRTARFVGRDGFDIAVRNPGDDATDFVGVNPEALRLVGLE